ncbi:MAG TPA: cytochrome c maturation protein CcmE [Acidimicrobiales bacterium]
MELTPRTLTDDADERGDAAAGAPARPTRRRRRRWLPLGVLAVVLVALGVLVYKGLSDATLYFRTADEAVAQRDELGTRRFRLQGTVVGEPTRTGDTVSFSVVHDDVEVQVRHVGDPPELFRTGIPVVLEGHWAEGEDVFDSDRILVKHDEEYVSQEDYERRMREAREDSEAEGGADAEPDAEGGAGARGGGG